MGFVMRVNVNVACALERETSNPLHICEHRVGLEIGCRSSADKAYTPLADATIRTEGVRIYFVKSGRRQQSDRPNAGCEAMLCGCELSPRGVCKDIGEGSTCRQQYSPPAQIMKSNRASGANLLECV